MNKKETKNVKISTETHRDLKIYAAQESVTLSEMITMALKNIKCFKMLLLQNAAMKIRAGVIELPETLYVHLDWMDDDGNVQIMKVHTTELEEIYKKMFPETEPSVN